MRRRPGDLFIALGLLLIAGAVGLSLYNLYDSYRAAYSSQQVIVYLEQVIPEEKVNTFLPENSDISMETTALEELEIPDYVLAPAMDMLVMEYNGNAYIGRLSIPALALELPVIDQWSYPALKIAPCRYAGSAYTDDLVIAGHNYKAHFAELSKLQRGDYIILTDADGNLFFYTVAVLETLAPTAIEEMTSDVWALTLFTCTPGGSYRMAVRCDKAMP